MSVTPKFGRSRSVDNLVVPVIDLLIASCGILLINPPDTATHVVGAALDLMLVSSHCSCTKLGCCTIMGSDHFLSVASASLVHRPAHIQSRRLLLLRNWSSTLAPLLERFWNLVGSWIFNPSPKCSRLWRDNCPTTFPRFMLTFCGSMISNRGGCAKIHKRAGHMWRWCRQDGWCAG